MNHSTNGPLFGSGIQLTNPSTNQRTQVGFNPIQWNPVSRGAKALVKKMLTVDPDARPSAAACLDSAWFSPGTSLCFLRQTIDPSKEGTRPDRCESA